MDVRKNTRSTTENVGHGPVALGAASGMDVPDGLEEGGPGELERSFKLRSSFLQAHPPQLASFFLRSTHYYSTSNHRQTPVGTHLHLLGLSRRTASRVLALPTLLPRRIRPRTRRIQFHLDDGIRRSTPSALSRQPATTQGEISFPSSSHVKRSSHASQSFASFFRPPSDSRRSHQEHDRGNVRLLLRVQASELHVQEGSVHLRVSSTGRARLRSQNDHSTLHWPQRLLPRVSLRH